MSSSNTDIDKLSVIVTRIWSDGFEAHQIKGTNDFNNLQLFTLTVSAPKGKKSRKHTLPFALCFKKENHQDIFIMLLKEVRALLEVTLRYWGEEKQFIPTIVMTDMVFNDWQERCANSSLSDKGLYHKRWQDYCIFDKMKTPACRRCDLERLRRIIEYETDIPAKSMKSSAIAPTCHQCLDWWTPGRDGVYPDDCKTYPIGPDAINLDDPTNFDLGIPALPMHMMALGVEKSLLKMLPSIPAGWP
jgi:hypothetical protein